VGVSVKVTQRSRAARRHPRAGILILAALLGTLTAPLGGMPASAGAAPPSAANPGWGRAGAPAAVPVAAPSAQPAGIASRLRATPLGKGDSVQGAEPSGPRGSGAAPPPGKGTIVTGATGAEVASSRLARTDHRLLGLTSSKPVDVTVKLDYEAIAAYQGGVAGFAATSPRATGKALNRSSLGYRRYRGHVLRVEDRFVARLRARLPRAVVGRRLRTVYGGVALRLPGNQVGDLLRVPGVVAVQRDRLQRPLTDASPDFLGAPTMYRALGADAGTGLTAGKGIIFGSLDSGVWPEHPAFADRADLGPVPPKRDGAPRACDFGDDPLTPRTDVFACNHKLISGQPFLDTYNATFNDEPYPDSARDSEGHGTHTASTAAGNPVAHAPVAGTDRGPIHGIAPGAFVAVYKVCGTQGCFDSDSVAAVAQAILDGVKVINFSISGGADPFSDPVELAFLDAFEAGVFVTASAGNSGPDTGTVEHDSPWVTTVAASTQRRFFQSTVAVRAGGATLSLAGGSSTPAGVPSPQPLVLASAPPYNDEQCLKPPPPGTFAGKIVVCSRQSPPGGPGRVGKGFNLRQGGAVGMLLLNSATQDVEADNHWLPTVNLDNPDGRRLLTFLAAHGGAVATATIGAGVKVDGQADVVASFSSRGPGGDWLKPDVAAPGMQILAGWTPTPSEPADGPPGELYQIIPGTSMASPHVAGSAILLLAEHPAWTPAQVKSALETTASTALVKEDHTTPADPFDAGGGRIDLNRAGDPGLTFDETGARMAATEDHPASRIDLNLPSVDATTMPGAITTTRQARNVSGRPLTYDVHTTAPAGAGIIVLPNHFTVPPGGRAKLLITISAPGLPTGQYFGEIRLDQRGGDRDVHLPVAFFHQQGQVTLSQSCGPAEIARNTGTSTCTASLSNTGMRVAKVSASSHVSGNLRVISATRARRIDAKDVGAVASLAAGTPATPRLQPGSLFGYVPLDQLGIAPRPIGDEQALNFNVPAFKFAGDTFSRIGVTSNGYLVAGGAESPDQIAPVPQRLPDPKRPNAVMAPFWTNLDGTGAPGILTADITDGTNTWIVVEWRERVAGTTSGRVFQVWIGVNGSEDVTYAYDPANLPAGPPAPLGLTVGAENAQGTGGTQLGSVPAGDLRVITDPERAGGTLTYRFKVRGIRAGNGSATTAMITPLVRGVTTEIDRIAVS
jgi:subtilisin family serine protease